VLDRGHFPAELVFVGLRRLVPDHLLLSVRVLALGQSRELFRPDFALKSPLLGELALPLAVALLLPAPVVGFLGRELAGMVRPRLATGERFGDRQHARKILGLDSLYLPHGVTSRNGNLRTFRRLVSLACHTMRLPLIGR
jgi:hypothetical protein